MPELHPLLKNTHLILGCASKGVYLSPAMRLVATTLLLWSDLWQEESGGRIGMTPDELADRTSLTPIQVDAALAKLEEVRFVQMRADGYILTFEEWKRDVLSKWKA